MRSVDRSPEAGRTCSRSRSPSNDRLRQPALAVAWHTAEDDAAAAAAPAPHARAVGHPRDKGRRRVERKVPELDGGSWARGRKVFFGEQAACAKCHTVHGQGGGIGPDLSNLVHRDYHSVLRDIADPSYAINPDHITYRVDLLDGRIAHRLVRTQGDKLLVGDATGTVTDGAARSTSSR